MELKTKIGYELHNSGVIFEITDGEFVDENGKVLGQANQHRKPIVPFFRQGDDVVETDISDKSDDFKSLAEIWWNENIKNSHHTKISQEIENDLTERKRNKQKEKSP